MLSIIINAFNMTREVPRTLHTLSRQYQYDSESIEYEVVVVENGSTEQLSEQVVRSFGPEFRYIYFDEGNPSPVRAINHAVSQSRGDTLCIMNDGARMLSPGMIRNAAAAFRAFPNAVVSPLSWHLGPEVQRQSVQKGYCQAVEDKLLKSIPWRENGYKLFTVSVLAGSSENGWFLPIAESNCLFMNRNDFEQLGGMDERFTSPGGGLIALDFFRNAWLLENIEPIILLGEGSFHQVHGGIATNAPAEVKEKRHQRMLDEYKAIHGKAYERPFREPTYLGKLPTEAHGFMKLSAENL
ncbi:MAG: glycosyltransferase [Methylococcales bacterium]